MDRIQCYQKKNQEISIEHSELDIQGIFDENQMDNGFEPLENRELDKNQIINNSDLEILEFFQQACMQLRKVWQIDYSPIEPISHRFKFC